MLVFSGPGGWSGLNSTLHHFLMVDTPQLTFFCPLLPTSCSQKQTHSFLLLWCLHSGRRSSWTGSFSSFPLATLCDPAGTHIPATAVSAPLLLPSSPCLMSSFYYGLLSLTLIDVNHPPVSCVPPNSRGHLTSLDSVSSKSSLDLSWWGSTPPPTALERRGQKMQQLSTKIPSHSPSAPSSLLCSLEKRWG